MAVEVVLVLDSCFSLAAGEEFVHTLELFCLHFLLIRGEAQVVIQGESLGLVGTISTTRVARVVDHLVSGGDTLSNHHRGVLALSLNRFEASGQGLSEDLDKPLEHKLDRALLSRSVSEVHQMNLQYLDVKDLQHCDYL